MSVPGRAKDTILRKTAAALAALTTLTTALTTPAAQAAPPARRNPETVAAVDRQPAAAAARPTRTLPASIRARHWRALHRIVRYARAHVGDRYQHGASGPHRFDCSGLTSASYRTARVGLPHSARLQARRGRQVSYRTARIGDLVVYGTHHVGVLVVKLRGRWYMVDAPGAGRRLQFRQPWPERDRQFRRIIA